jgi:hypothetical protein
MNRRNFIISTLATAGLILAKPIRGSIASTLIPKKLKAINSTKYAPALNYFNKETFDISKDETWPCFRVLRLEENGHIKIVPKIGLIDKDHVPEGTKLKEWTIFNNRDEYQNFTRANDIEQWYNQAIDEKVSIYHGYYGYYVYHHYENLATKIRFCYSGDHPIYRRLFPMPGI